MIHDDDAYLLISYLHDELTSDEVDRLVQRLQTDAALLAQLVVISQDEVRMIDWATQKRQPATVCTRQRKPRTSRAPYQITRFAAVAAAVLFFFGAGLAIQQLSGVPDRNNASVIAKLPDDSFDEGNSTRDIFAGRVAMIEATPDECEFFIENRVRDSDQSETVIRAGDTLRLLSGELEMVFVHGTTVSLRAPAVFEVSNDMHIRMHRGSIRVNVADGAEGFEVLTPVARVIDLGTQFGVIVDEEGMTDVAVFEGAVDLEGGFDEVGHAPIMRRLVAGEAVQLDRRGTLSRIVTVADGRFPTCRSQAAPGPVSSGPNVITEVWDNIERDESYKFYEIVRAGMDEDAKAFVDRVYHEWNGVDASGMPAYLIGGDYVKTFNSDKMNSSLGISLHVARPAAIYLLLDNRVPIPSWLSKQFVDTGDDVGIDEGFEDGGMFDQHTSVGPGVSIDNTFSIWKRDVEAPTVLRLGAIEELAPGPNPSWINMYGIVAVPLDELL